MTDRHLNQYPTGADENMSAFARYMYELPEGDPITLTVASALLAGKISLDEAIMLDSSEETFPDITNL